MKALIYNGPNKLTFSDYQQPALEPGEAIVRIDAVGICGSDMHAYHGHDPRRKPGLIMGHEFAGTIVDGPGTGRRVTGNPLIACGRCEYCRQGRSNLCADRTMIGMTRPGAYAQFMSTPLKTLIDLPDNMSTIDAALAEPAATALHAIALAQRSLHRPLPECQVLVIGAGAIGMLSALLLRSYGVKSVWVAETNALRRASVQDHAGALAFDPTRDTGPGDSQCDLVIDAVGAAPTRELMINAAKPGSVIVHVGLQAWTSEIDMRKITLQELTLIGTYTYTDVDLLATVDALSRHQFGDLAWVETRALADGPQAFDDLDNGRSASAKIVLQPH